jgi:hypothetical protein
MTTTTTEEKKMTQHKWGFEELLILTDYVATQARGPWSGADTLQQADFAECRDTLFPHIALSALYMRALDLARFLGLMPDRPGPKSRNIALVTELYLYYPDEMSRTARDLAAVRAIRARATAAQKVTA